MWQKTFFFVVNVILFSGMTVWGEEIQSEGEGVTVGDGYARYDGGSRRWEIGTCSVRLSLAEEEGRLVWKGLENLAAKDAVQYIERAGDMPFRVETGLAETENSFWKIQGSQMREVTVGGRPAVELDFVLARENLQARLQIVAHPGTAILRQRVELKNTGSIPVKLSAAVPFQMYLGEKFFPSMTNYWLFGGTNTADQGVMQSADMGASYQNVLPGENTGNFVPWMGFLRKEESRDGWFAALDWLGRWTLGVERRETAEKEEEADTYTSDFNGCHRISKSAESSMHPSPVGNQRIHLVRAVDGTQEVIWKSLVVPQEVKQGESYTFQWLAATGYQSQPQGTFTLFLGDKELLEFQVTQSTQSWTGKVQGVVLDYEVTTANGEDSMGTMRLTVPAALLTPGKRAVLRVAASNSASRQWFGIYDYPCLRGGEAFFTSGTDDLSGYELKPGQAVGLPLVTFGVFGDTLDNMAEQLYRWQYEYMWDFTNNEYYAKTKYATSWVFCSRNLQEQFTARLGWLDMDSLDLLRSLGIDMLWDDAGWAKFPGWPIEDSYSTVFAASYEGPDFAQTQRYLQKMGMKWLLWMAGRPTPGVMDTKVGSWGDYQWRTDAIGWSGPEDGAGFMQQLDAFLTKHPGSSFHTCNGGSRYSHQFEIQRFADVNYLSDAGRGKVINQYFSYLDTPDKWLDGIDNFFRNWGEKGVYCFYRQLLLAPMWAFLDVVGKQPEHLAQVARVNEIYSYLLREGVVGRWSLVHHPAVAGDKEFNYLQRTSYDRKRAVIIPSLAAEGSARVYPRGLLGEYEYEVGFNTAAPTSRRGGADLMESGIEVGGVDTGGLIYLGLPDRPGFGLDKTAPQKPSRVLYRRENNIGYGGVGIYWCPGSDDKWVSHYEIRRGEQVIGSTAKGLYYFDYAEGWNPQDRYQVRTVDADGNTSPWADAAPISPEPLAYAAMGGHFARSGREGWSAETSADGQNFAEMTWVAPAKCPAGDFGGTPNQPGGIEGYWEGPGQARVGRGWQEVSAEVLCARVWTAPAAGTVRILGRAMKEFYRQGKGQPCRVKILQGARQIWPQQEWATVALNDFSGVQHDVRAKVVAGEKIRFVLDRGTSEGSDVKDIVAWMPRIMYETNNTNAGGLEGSIVRILCGSPRDYTDGCGNVWSADRYYTGGEPYQTAAEITAVLPTEKDQSLYQGGRAGKEFTYCIPVQLGLYALRLKFTEPEFAYFFSRPFCLEINGREVIRNEDICHVSRGPRRACDRIFRYLVPDRDGNLVLRFRGGWDPLQKTDAALVQAIEVLPERRQVIRVNVGADRDFVDWNSDLWAVDSGSEGKVLRSEAMVEQASPTLYDQELYRTARSGKDLTYSFAVPAGLYTVHLKFAELWLKEAGQRPMDIAINGRCFWKSWEPSIQAGKVGMSADVRVDGITPDWQGLITLRINAAGNQDAILQAIEIE